jgi:hypothetical protein
MTTFLRWKLVLPKKMKILPWLLSTMVGIADRVMMEALHLLPIPVVQRATLEREGMLDSRVKVILPMFTIDFFYLPENDTGLIF